MPSTPVTVPALWLWGCAVLLGLGAALLAAGGGDRDAFLALHAAAARLPSWLPSGLTILGHGLVGVVLVTPFLRQEPWVPTAALYAALPASAFSRLGKMLAHRPRPAAVLDPGALHVQGPVLLGQNSFPSGHSITVFLVATVIVLGSRRFDRPLGRAAILVLASAAAASRILVGAHWPSDAIGGALLGMLAGAIGTWGARRAPLWRSPGGRHLLAFAALACAASLLAADTGYPLALPLQSALALLGLGLAGAALVRPLAPLPAGAMANPAS